MSTIKKIARKTIIPFIYNLGYHKNKIVKHHHNNFILCYHGVSNSPNFRINNRHIPSVEFEKNLIFFKKYFNIVSLNEIFDDYRNNVRSSIPKVALTFDDGYLNNLTTALPLLEKYKAPATFYIITAGLEDENFMSWSDIIDIAIYANKLNSFTFHNKTFTKTNNIFIEDESKIDVASFIKLMGKERDNSLIEFKHKYLSEAAIQSNKEYWKLVNKNELRKCAENTLIDIGSHTHTHYNLGNIAIELAKKELINSKNVLEQAIQKEVISIAYPDGHYTNNVKDESEKAGYKNLCAVSFLSDSDKADKRILNRFSISNSTTHQSNIIRLASQINSVGI